MQLMFIYIGKLYILAAAFNNADKFVWNMNNFAWNILD